MVVAPKKPMNTHHTDSRLPWRVVQSVEGFWQVWTAQNNEPGSRNNYVIADGIQTEAETRLISAAPDLLAALQACLEIVRGSAEMPHPMPGIAQKQWDVFHQARAAINKATKTP